MKFVLGNFLWTYTMNKSSFEQIKNAAAQGGSDELFHLLGMNGMIHNPYRRNLDRSNISYSFDC